MTLSEYKERLKCDIIFDQFFPFILLHASSLLFFSCFGLDW